MAAFRDVGSFFKYQASDDFGNANPIAGARHASSIARHLAIGQLHAPVHLLRHEPGRGEPQAARRRRGRRSPAAASPLNVRWGQPDGVLELYQMGSEGPQWWVDYPDVARNLPAGGIFDRCTLTGTCPEGRSSTSAARKCSR